MAKKNNESKPIEQVYLKANMTFCFCSHYSQSSITQFLMLTISEKSVLKTIRWRNKYLLFFWL